MVDFGEICKTLVQRAGEQLPLTVDEVTLEWLSKVLGVPIISFEVKEIIHGSGSKILIKLSYPNASRHSFPTNLCVKGGFNPEILQSLPMLFNVYRLEALFYHQIGPRIPGLRLIPSYWQGIDRPSGKGQGIFILQDVAAAGFTFGNPLQPWSADQVREALAQLAALHAATWGEKKTRGAGIPWDRSWSGMRGVIEGMMSPSHWKLRFSDSAVRPPVSEVFWDNRERIVRCFHALWDDAEGWKMECLVHGDTQVGNTFIDAKGQPGFLDWQCVHVNSAAHDVAYFITGALAVEDRRRHERELFGYYLEELFRVGGPGLEVDQVWDEYRAHQMHGFAWALAGPMMQSKEVVDVMSQRHCAAILDHQSMDLLVPLEN
ncbi:hypothetical protein M406DRAFT_337038 [Cryphonectria parasitica EP155]|uniref:CHK kinase-like domain-containing protein n=1 Tax=Cryphonectria parasitica (strain ATCC 38755 / EP155) TaxID=660469 RepID=A0A9P4Y8C6_CRYP1|nr:uncharacterized protein M406DRAFT_337038 [Cryphonectria parasitica EP155]KAF3768643.1 hypothetical protein M406DRAFT_337038 [Cryphonectria parasitica EP155]